MILQLNCKSFWTISDRYKDKKPTKPGELVQIDTKHEYVNGRKVYIFVAKDVKTRISSS
jgi:predicted thioesterase